jgi:hypothetical protein
MNMISQPIAADDMRSVVSSIMDCAGTPAERARRMATTMNDLLDDGRFARLASRELVALRAVVWAAAAIADDLDETKQQRQPVRPVRWWRRWL